MTKRIKSQKLSKTSLLIRLGFTKMRAKQTSRKKEEDLIALQLNELLDKTALIELETFLKRHNQPQLMSHTEGQKAHQGLHRYKGAKRDLHSDPRLHILHQSQHKMAKTLHLLTDKEEMKTETTAETDIQGTRGTIEARVAPELIKDDLTGTEVPADKDNKVSNDETPRTTTEVDQPRGPTIIATEQIQHFAIETDQMKVAAPHRIVTIDAPQKTQALTDQCLFTSTKQSRKTE